MWSNGGSRIPKPHRRLALGGQAPHCQFLPLLYPKLCPTELKISFRKTYPYTIAYHLPSLPAVAHALRANAVPLRTSTPPSRHARGPLLVITHPKSNCKQHRYVVTYRQSVTVLVVYKNCLCCSCKSTQLLTYFLCRLPQRPAPLVHPFHPFAQTRYADEPVNARTIPASCIPRRYPFVALALCTRKREERSTESNEVQQSSHYLDHRSLSPTAYRTDCLRIHKRIRALE